MANEPNQPIHLAFAQTQTILADFVVKETAVCYLIREQRVGAALADDPAVPQNPDRLRPRWAGAIAATLIGGFAVAAMVAPPSVPPRAADSAAPAPIAASAVALPTETASRQSSTPVDDGVPAAPDTLKAGMGDCSHAL